MPPCGCCRRSALGCAPTICGGGDYPGNVICAVLMSLLLYHVVHGLFFMRAHPDRAASRPLYIAALVFCALEYALWTTSCFWSGDAWSTPYFLCDCLMSAYMPFLLASYRKAVAE